MPPAGASQCDAFMPIRQEAEKAIAQIQTAGQRKLPREEVCTLFKALNAAETKMIKFLVSNQSACNIPKEAITGARTNHAKSFSVRKQVCAEGVAAGPAPGPSLSEALGAPIVPDDATPKTGRGIFDTLTGSPLAR